jgi:hypothetical protein
MGGTSVFATTFAMAKKKAFKFSDYFKNNFATKARSFIFHAHSPKFYLIIVPCYQISFEKFLIFPLNSKYPL